jgi:hypothetical protein
MSTGFMAARRGQNSRGKRHRCLATGSTSELWSLAEVSYRDMVQDRRSAHFGRNRARPTASRAERAPCTGARSTPGSRRDRPKGADLLGVVDDGIK